MPTSLRRALERLFPSLALALIVALAAPLAHAQDARRSSRTHPTVGTPITPGASSTPASTERTPSRTHPTAGTPITLGAPSPPATAERGGGITLSQSTSEEIADGLGCNGPADASSQSSVYRVFDLAAEGVTAPFRPVSFRTGVSASVGTATPITIRIYTLTDPSAPISLGNLTGVVSGSTTLDPNAAGMVAEFGLGDSVPPIAPDAMLVVEFATLGEDADVIVAGVNGAGESAPTYVYSSNCGDTDIIEASTVVSPSDWVMSLTGVAEAGGPANDNFFGTGDFRIEPGTTTTGTNVGATLEPTEVQTTCQASDGASVWWFFTAPADGTVTFDLSASDFDTVVALYPINEARLPRADEESACDDDGGTGLTSLITDVPVTGGVFYALRVSGFVSGTVQREGNISFDFTFAPIVASEQTPAGEISLTAAPNPTATQSRVTLSVPTAQAMTVEVFDVTGRRVATLHDGAVAAGSISLDLDASALPSGVYVVRAVGETVSLSERVTVVR